jgi:two-component system response regulator PilR (NtrC family)
MHSAIFDWRVRRPLRRCVGVPPAREWVGAPPIAGAPESIGGFGAPPIAASEVDMELTRILVVDDEEEICETTKSFLQRKGYVVYTAQTKQQAVDVLKKSRPQLMLLDIRLGQESGLDLLRQTRELDKDIKIIMVSAVEDGEKILQAKSLGADDYVTKPFTTQYLNDFILRKISKLVLGQKEQ